MAIGSAIQRSHVVHIYDEDRRQTATVLAGTGRDDGLTGYTASRVNVRRGSFVYSYDEHGQQCGTFLAV
jgi:hypothetical protein